MPRDSLGEALAWPSKVWDRFKGFGWPRWPLAAAADRRRFGLSSKLLLLTIVFVMLAEVLTSSPRWRTFASPG